MCPAIVMVDVEAVLSIDELWTWLPYNHREPATVEAISRRIKGTVARDVSPVIKVSIGVGPILHPLKLRDPSG